MAGRGRAVVQGGSCAAWWLLVRLWWHGGAAGPRKSFVAGGAVGVQLGTRFSGRLSRRRPAGGDDGGARGRRPPGGGVIMEPIPSARVSLGENPVHLLDERRRRHWRRPLHGGVPSMEASSLETSLSASRRGAYVKRHEKHP